MVKSDLTKLCLSNRFIINDFANRQNCWLQSVDCVRTSDCGSLSSLGRTNKIENYIQGGAQTERQGWWHQYFSETIKNVLSIDIRDVMTCQLEQSLVSSINWNDKIQPHFYSDFVVSSETLIPGLIIFWCWTQPPHLTESLFELWALFLTKYEGNLRR